MKTVSAPSPILFLVGPTAVGKSEIAVYLAKRFNGEIISADSMQIYRNMDIGTAKPSARTRRQVKHHMIDICSPAQSFSVYDYHRLALVAILDTVKRGKRPIVVGGSGFYVRSLLEGLEPLPGPDLSLRLALKRMSRVQGWPALYQRLKHVDPKRAKKIKPADKKRIIRALEIHELTKSRKKTRRPKKGSVRALNLIPTVIGITSSREKLYEVIEARVDRMFRAGLVQEVKRLRNKRISRTAAQALGYKQLLAAMGAKNNGRITPKALFEAKLSIKRATRRFAKRQITWFKREKGIRWISLDPKAPKQPILAQMKALLEPLFLA